MQKLLIATTNPGKLDEIRHFLSDLPCQMVSLGDEGITNFVAETGQTFDENARIKASFYAKLSGLPTIADDGGFEIDALNGEPGVHSHRWVDSNRESSDDDLIAYTFKQLQGVPEGKRGAQLGVVLALAHPNGAIVATTKAAVRGVVPIEPSKTRYEGFPYRSILFLPKINKFYDNKALTSEETERFNHRKKALEGLKPYVLQLFSESV